MVKLLLQILSSVRRRRTKVLHNYDTLYETVLPASKKLISPEITESLDDTWEVIQTLFPIFIFWIWLVDSDFEVENGHFHFVGGFFCGKVLSLRVFQLPLLPLLCRWRPVSAHEDSSFSYLEQEILTNSTQTRHTLTNLQPYTVYSFQISAINHVGRSKPSKNSYPAITLRESKCTSEQSG